MRIDILKLSDFDWWWIHVDGKQMDITLTRWGARRKATRFAKAHNLRKQDSTTKPYQYGFGRAYPYETWSD